MNWHHALHYCVRRLGIHHVENTMHDLVAAGTEKCRAQDFLAVSIGDDLHETLCLATLNGTAHLCHRTYSDENVAAGFESFRFRHAGATKRRIDIERVGGLAVAHAAIVAVQQVCGNDLEIVVGGMGESAFAVAVAERVDVRWLVRRSSPTVM